MSLVALKVALKLTEAAGARTVLADVRALALPLYDDDKPLEWYPPTLPWLLDEVRAADGFIFCSPTYHGTIAGAVKNALDALQFTYTEQYLGEKPVGLLAMGGQSAPNVITALWHTTRTLNGLAVPMTAVVGKDTLDAETLDIRDANVKRRVETMARQVIDLAAYLRQRRVAPKS